MTKPRVIIDPDKIIPCTECRVQSGHKMDCSLRPTIRGRDVAREALRLAVSNQRYEYPAASRCVYVPDPHRGGGPACLFGQALVNLGVDPNRLLHIQRQAMDTDSDSIANMLRHLGISTEEDVDVACNEAQAQQDVGTPWGGSSIITPLLGVFMEVAP